MAHSKKAEGKHAVKKQAKPSHTSSAASAGSSTGSGLRALYVELASNLDKFSNFVADPAAVVKQSGLSKEETDLLFSGDQGRIYASLRPEMVPTPPQPQQSTGQAGAATQAAPAPGPASPQSPWPNAYPYGFNASPYGYGWPSYWPATSPYPGSFVQTASSCPTKRPPEQKR